MRTPLILIAALLAPWCSVDALAQDDSPATPARLIAASCDPGGAMSLTARTLQEGGDSTARSTVTLTISVSAAGEVQTVAVAQRNVSKRLADSVRREVASCRFEPALKAGQPITSTTQLVVALEDGHFVVGGGLRCPFARFPRSVAWRGDVVEATIRVHLAASGTPARTEMQRSSTIREFDETAAEASFKCGWIGPTPPPGFVDVHYQWRE
jgi:TonB family protein